MKKIFLTLFIVLGFYSLSFAQRRGDVEFGVNVGFNDASTSQGDYYGYSNDIVGFNAAVSADYYFSRNWSLKVKAIYDQKGFSDGYITLNDGTEIDGVDYHLNYLTIPVMADWHLGYERNWYVDFGPYIGILLNANAAGYNVKDSFNTTDGGLAFGIGYKFPIAKRTKFFIELESQVGVANIGSYNFDGPNTQNERSSLNIGLNF